LISSDTRGTALPGWKAGWVRGASISHQEERIVRYLTGSAATVAILALGSIAGAQTMQNGSEPRELTAEVVMKDKAFHITQAQGEMGFVSIQGGSGRGILLMADTHADIRLRNEDTVAHEFVSTILYKVPFRLSGTGTFLEAPQAAGVRVGPGQTVVLSFEVPYSREEHEHMYETFWCNVHGKHHVDRMRGEIVIVDVR